MNLDVEGLNLVNLLRTSATALIPQKRKDGKWVVENYSGGDLLSYEEMKAAVRAKEDAKALKEANKKSGPLEKREQAAMNLHDKKQYQTARTQLVLQREEKRNAKAQQAAHRTNKKDPGASKLRKKPPPASQPSAKPNGNI
ncbi:hypothetical protein PInf_004410 [Phytophthora infestans]|nr:hypothetical protein PInf_004410 [Phytophthora infestans]